jgi:lipooligosaccharide transport system permease protein
VLTGFGFACFGIWISGIVPSIDSFGYVISAGADAVVPRRGNVLPHRRLPGWAQAAAQLNPLFHCVELVRGAPSSDSPRTTCCTCWR